MLTCAQITELLTDYMEGRLPFGQRLRFQMHVGMCRHCRAYLRSMRVTLKALGKLPETPPPDDVRAELLRRFAEWKG
ncbi:MAG: zf-HC2 domain-containing protein [Polyangiaceae bacterium]